MEGEADDDVEDNFWWKSEEGGCHIGSRLLHFFRSEFSSVWMENRIVIGGVGRIQTYTSHTLVAVSRICVSTFSTRDTIPDNKHLPKKNKSIMQQNHLICSI